VALNSNSQTAISGYASFLQSLRSDVVGPAHPLVPVSMGYWEAGCWRVKTFAIHQQEGMHTVAWIYAARSTDGGCVARQHRSEATGGGRRTRQRGVLSQSEASHTSSTHKHPN